MKSTKRNDNFQNENCRFFLGKPNHKDIFIQVIFQLRWSDIFDKSKAILKPFGFSDIIFAIKLCKAQ